MHSAKRRITTKQVQRYPVGQCSPASQTEMDQMRSTVELAIAMEQQIVKLRPVEHVVPPHRVGSIEAIKIGFDNLAACKELVVLLGSGNRGEDIKRRRIRIQFDERVEMLLDARFCVFW